MDKNHFDDNKRIARNSAYLYVRMLALMVVTLFTFRILLKQLGVEGFGTYGAVCGIVVFFSFLSNALAQSNQRHLSYSLGREDWTALSRTFSMIINIHLVIGGVVIVIAESFGVWFLNFKMDFTGESMTVVNIVYQFSILTFLIQLIQIPYISAIISHEQMKVFSYAGIADSILRLVAVLSLSMFSSRRLVIYSVLVPLIAMIMLAVYYYYCRSNFSECRYRKIWDKRLMRRLFMLPGWNMVGGLGTVGASQAINILFNISGGVVLNAAMGITHQVHIALNMLIVNLHKAFNPQIVKAYAIKDINYFDSLIFRASRLSFFLVTIVGVPLILCMNEILSLWLTDVPEYSVPFTQLTIIYCMIECLSGPLRTANQAYGRVGFYMVVVALISLSIIPAGLILLRHGFHPISILVARLIIGGILLLFRILYIKITMNFPLRKYLIQVGVKVVAIVVLIAVVYGLLDSITAFHGLGKIIVSGGGMFLMTSVLGFMLLMNRSERRFIAKKLLSIRAC